MVLTTASGRSKAACAVLAAGMIAGCASPMVRWKDPQQDAPENTMAYARAYAESARQAYQHAADAQVKLSTNLSSGLIGLGGVIAGLAAFGASGDAITGTALLGGTAYALGNWNVNRQRQLVYLAGVDAINCAEDVVSPFDVSPARRESLRNRLSELEAKLNQATRASNRVRRGQAGLARNEQNRQLHEEAERLLAEARSVAATGRDVLDRGRDIDGRIDLAGGDLVRSVKRISAAIDKAVLDTVPDLAAVRTVIGSVSSFAGVFAPGSGVESRISTALGKAEEGFKIQARISSAADTAEQKELKSALDGLETAIDDLESAVALARNATPKIPDTKELAKCGINVSFAFTATPASVEMKGGVDELHIVVLTGGNKPYVAQLQGAGAKGLTVRSPLPGDRAVVIAGNSELAAGQQFKVLATDASDPPRSIVFAINVGGAPAEGTKGRKDTPPANDAASRIGSVVPFKMTNTTISIRTAAAQPNGNVLVTIHCDGKPATLFTRAEIAATLREQSVDGSKIGADIAADKIQIDGPKDCVEGGSIQSRVRKAEVPRQRPNDEVRILQARLCLPYFEANGLWGRNTQRALDAWRVRTGSNATGKPITDEERTTILGAEPTAAAKWCAT